MHRVEDLTDGDVRWAPARSTASIKRMLADGLIEEADERPDPTLDDQRRRYYRITAEGERACAGEVARIETLLRNARRREPEVGARGMSGERLVPQPAAPVPAALPPRSPRPDGAALPGPTSRSRPRRRGSRPSRDAVRHGCPVQHKEAFMHHEPARQAPKRRHGDDDRHRGVRRRSAAPTAPSS